MNIYKIYKSLQKFGAVLLLLIALQNLNAFGIKYGNEFLKFGTGVRENSLGGAVISNSQPVVSAYWNPALLSRAADPEIQIMHTEEFAGVVNNDHVFVTLPGQRDFKFSAGFFRTGVDNIPATENSLVEYGTQNGRLDADDRIDYEKISYFNASESAFFLAGSKPVYNNLSMGATFKTIHKNLYEKYAWGVGLDLGLFYEPFEGLMAGAVARNITTTFLYWNDGEKEIVKPTLALGTSYNLLITPLKLKITPLAGLDLNFTGKQYNTDLNIQSMNLRFRGGVEFEYREIFAIRTGQDDLGGIHLGCGLNTKYGNLDYGFAMGAGYSDLGNSHRVAITFKINSLQQLIKNR